MMLHVLIAGDGPAVLLVHGAAEDAELLRPQAQALADRGFRAVWYDRRGTGRSGREDWPGSGADQHADDAADLIAAYGLADVTVLGFSSGGVIALALAARHPERVREAVAWEPAAVTMLPDGEALHAGLVRPMEAHLASRPGDFAGAYHVMLDVLSEGRADHSDPAVLRMLANAEAAIRDDARLITARTFRAGELPAAKVTLAVAERGDPMHRAMAGHLAALVGTPVVEVAGADDHEVYLRRPEVIADWLAGRLVRAF